MVSRANATLSLSLLLVACGDDLILPSPPPPSGLDVRIQRILSADGDADAGLEVFREHCVFCHAESGEATVGPALAAWVPSEPEARTLEIVFVGQGGMPGVDLTDEEAADLLAWLRASFAD